MSPRLTAPTRSTPAPAPWRRGRGGEPQRGHGFTASGLHPSRRWPAHFFAVALVLALASGSLLPAGSTTPAKIKTDWIAFFAGSTPAKRKIALLQNGEKFAAIIDGQASSPLSKSVTATVAAVTVLSGTKAKVRYSLDLGGEPALANQAGVAVLQGGTWKVGDQSFCALLALEQVKGPGCTKG